MRSMMGRSNKRRNKIDHTDSLPDECLTLIFNNLTSTNDRNNSSLVSHRWLRVEAQTRTHLSLYAPSSLELLIPSIFTRFNSLTKLVLSSIGCRSINDNDIILITSMCPNLTRLELLACDQLTDSGMDVFSKNCKKLKEFSCRVCAFSYIGIAALLDNSSHLEILSVVFHPVVKTRPNFRAANSLKVIEFSCVGNERLFRPFIVGSNNLKLLKLIKCEGNWDRSFEMIRDDNCLVEVHLEDVNVTDVGVSSLSKCRDLTALYIYDVKCTNVGLISFAENCKGLKKLYIGYSKKGYWNNIGNEGLIAVGMHSVNLEELTLTGVCATCVSLEVIATNCRKLISLEVYWCAPINKEELMCIAKKCVALRRLRIDREVYEDFAEPEPVSTSSEAFAEPEPVSTSFEAFTGPEPVSTSSEAFTGPEPVSTSSSSIGNGAPTLMSGLMKHLSFWTPLEQAICNLYVLSKLANAIQ